VLDTLAGIRADIVEHPQKAAHRLRRVHPTHLASANNLLHYLALRRRDLRPLQMELAELGLSSLGRAESNVLASVDAVLGVLRHLSQPAGQPAPLPMSSPALGFADGEHLLARNRDDLLGPPTPGRGVRIMVTMPGEAAHDYALVHDLLRLGMECMRINCAHDDAAAWLLMIGHLRRAEKALGRTCRVVMDLAGPKLRTGPVEPGPAVLRIRPARDAWGRVLAPARIWLTSESEPVPPPTPADACLPVDSQWRERLLPDARIHFIDARESGRSFTVVESQAAGCWAESTQTVYLTPGTVLRYEHGGAVHKAPIGEFLRPEGALTLKRGDLLTVRRSLAPGAPATHDSAGRILTPAAIGCTIPEVFDDARPGEAIWFDDGSIGGVMEQIEADRVLVRITHARPEGSRLRADKGINLPDSALRLPALTAKDLQDLEFVARHADIVELSFANEAADVDALQEHLQRLGTPDMAIVLKVETRRGFEHLPEMLLSAMRSPHCGVMIARGDLAVECGFERLAEVQEEILWICEAAHVPVIWATQVLETLAKQGMPSRAEITDAAMGHRAECVMLNKGPHVLTAVQVLDDILRRMQAHQTKKRAMLRELRLAHTLPQDDTPDPRES